MAADEYGLEAFVSDVRRIMSQPLDEPSVLAQVAPLARRAALASGWRSEVNYLADPQLGFGTTLLHAEADHSLFVVADCWLAGRGVNAHDHGTWAVVVGVDGREKNIHWQRVDDGTQAGYAELRKVREETLAEGDVLTMPTGAIHSVLNETANTTLSFHVYGRHLNHTGRSQFDPEQKVEKPFIIETQQSG
ncbi:putative metal-dependent enzyme (double-stranded beta helix superfamily) [Pseudomonas sp. SJZ079]|uniref:cysteine dioxygenase family protein n=1 Tax=Pseudomonas sp. SJZ079 TaxID=2572887 RepID=UPI00119A119A|nr:cysteine dioxygenase family protein [Pseudomonas sp. SJZ079]TWC35691.1 putative metal-dependent enzyme (double-stranded beta helix superfamily) [Pseudomonas sp. SJZ079]